MDPFTLTAIPIDLVGDVSAYELDHIFEKQCFAHVVARADLGKDDHNQIVDLLREEVVNVDENLSLTRKSVNQLKGRGVYGFLDDRATGHQSRDADLTSYLLNANNGDEKLSRKETGRICGEIKKSAKRAQLWFDDQGENRPFEVTAEEIQKLITDLKL
ncbi:hypothetical protein M427DRAFT_43486 [Gonapodya prolifera JEL478]|uniref:Uncharacterized protein n=1 Tax=Gonapodya prolifera (strain JEL478) TaxID=1344416 RepID=A0A139AJ05_GONPJ|nr:hypothetical protein M427DRAFT_43486 [Gonapodya prolifera JEL478]|eukprot:KXS16699.1 hypothetical protein M427DRAFT_43486 [Gonapodya prolifera JEL478]